MSRACQFCLDYGGKERRSWVLEAQRRFLNMPPTLWDIVSYAVLGTLIVCALMVW